MFLVLLVADVKMFDDDMRAEITFSGTPGIVTLKLTDNKKCI
jgi:hypothetical protein